MPIRPENRARYPRDWPELSVAARQRAQWRCQHPGCGAQQYAVGWWRLSLRGYEWVAQWPRGGAYIGQTYADARTVADSIYAALGDRRPKPTVIVLTVAHLNHEPEDCRPENLAAMCQRHHLAYDAEHHARTAYETRRRARRTADLFEAFGSSA